MLEGGTSERALHKRKRLYVSLMSAYIERERDRSSLFVDLHPSTSLTLAEPASRRPNDADA